ncbi:hypothetical protein D7236_22065 [Stutzerimonas stutzeri]|nr:hypothetical protein [Stutzerimonas stutzeri]
MSGSAGASPQRRASIQRRVSIQQKDRYIQRRIRYIQRRIRYIQRRVRYIQRRVRVTRESGQFQQLTKELLIDDTNNQLRPSLRRETRQTMACL